MGGVGGKTRPWRVCVCVCVFSKHKISSLNVGDDTSQPKTCRSKKQRNVLIAWKLGHDLFGIRI